MKTKKQVAKKVERRVNELFAEGLLPKLRDSELENLTIMLTKIVWDEVKIRKGLPSER